MSLVGVLVGYGRCYLVAWFLIKNDMNDLRRELTNSTIAQGTPSFIMVGH